MNKISVRLDFEIDGEPNSTQVSFDSATGCKIVFGPLWEHGGEAVEPVLYRNDLKLLEELVSVVLKYKDRYQPKRITSDEHPEEEGEESRQSNRAGGQPAQTNPR